MGAYQGLVIAGQTGILIPRMKEGYLGTATFPRTNATGSFETMKLPLRAEKSLFTWTMMKQNDVSTSPNMIFYQCAGSLVYVYSGVEFLQNLMLLSQGQCHAWFSDLNANFYSFIEEAGTYVAPTGTETCSIGYKYTISQMKQATTEIMLKTVMTDTEFELFNGSTGSFITSYQAGTIDGSAGALGLVALASQNAVSRPGFKSITANGVSIGEIHNDTEFTVEGSGIVAGNKGREYSRMAKVTLKAVGVQENPTNALGAINHSKSPNSEAYVVLATDYSDNVWSLTGAKPDITIKRGDEVGTLEVNMMTEYPYDFTNAIDFSDLTHPTFVQEGLY